MGHLIRKGMIQCPKDGTQKVTVDILPQEEQRLVAVEMSTYTALCPVCGKRCEVTFQASPD